MKTPDFWFRPSSAAAKLLAPASTLYDVASRLSRAATPGQNVEANIICIGNLVAGGAGKTPVALAIAELLATDDIAFLTRGYGGRETGPLQVDPDTHTARDVGDEALLLARQAPTWVARDRPKGAREAARKGARTIIMDDGFQNPSLVKDTAILVVDGATGFGNRRVIPAGPLRETIANGLARAHAVIVIGDDETGVLGEIGNRVAVFTARLVPTAGVRELAGRRVLAFAGIGRPQKFFDTLVELGCDIVEQHAFADHKPHRPAQIMALCEQAAKLEAVPVTTEKDLVRLPPEAREMVQSVPVVLTWDDREAVSAFLSARPA